MHFDGYVIAISEMHTISGSQRRLVGRTDGRTDVLLYFSFLA